MTKNTFFPLVVTKEYFDGKVIILPIMSDCETCQTKATLGSWLCNKMLQGSFWRRSYALNARYYPGNTSYHTIAVSRVYGYYLTWSIVCSNKECVLYGSGKYFSESSYANTQLTLEMDEYRSQQQTLVLI